ncbi:MAG: type II toxin-antitoxin system RelE/ParE family toxin [Pseudomonadota bacterium]
MLLKVAYRPAADSDIEAIADYTIERWGLSQAQSYLAALRADAESLAENALLYPIHQASGLGMRRMKSGHHNIFYLLSDETVEIIRILHERMDTDNLI